MTEQFSETAWGTMPSAPADLLTDGAATPIPRTPAEIVARMRDNADVFGFAAEVLLAFVGSPDCDELLKPEFKGKQVAEVRTVEHAMACARDYYRFAWGKVLDHRGISASRSITKLAAWMWVAGRDDLAALLHRDDLYTPYGAPALKALGAALGWPWPEDDEQARRMAAGEPCRPYCDEGCRS